MVRGYTTIEQSRKLAEILPLESADMFYTLIDQGLYLEVKQGIEPLKDDIPCWSLSSLMNIIEKIEKVEICFNCSSNKYWVDVHFESLGSFCQDHELYDSKIDALIALIKKLKSRNLL